MKLESRAESVWSPARLFKQKKRSRVSFVTLMFLVPSLLSFLIFKYVPMFYAIFMSFFTFDVMHPPGAFIGLRNYQEMFKSSLFTNALYNTFAIAFLSIVLTFWVPIFQAMLLMGIKKGNTFIRFLYLLPTAVPGVASILLWKWMYNPDYGLFNSLLQKVGLKPLGWLNDPAMAKFSLVLPGVVGGGLSVLIYYSALQGVSEEIVESAKIDGAGPWRRIIFILLPSLKFIIGINFIAFLSAIFLSFDNIFIMTGGGPANSTTVMSMLVYNSAFKENRFGMAGAISLFVLIIISLVTYIQMKISNRE